MQTPILALAGFTTGPNTSTARYSALFGGIATANWNATAGIIAVPIPAAGTFSKLRIRFPATGTGSYAITLVKNGVDQALTCSVNLASTDSANDLTNSFSVAAGDLVYIKCVPTGTPTTQTVVQISMLFTATTLGESLILGGSNRTASATGGYSPFGGGDTNAGFANVAGVVGAPGVLSKLYVSLSAAPTSTNTYQVEIYKNGSATGVTCTITGAAITGGDLSNTVSVAAGDRIAFRVVPTGSPTATVANVGVRFVPTTLGESLLMAYWGTAPSVALDRFNCVNGGANNNTTETNSLNLAPVDFVAKKLYLNVGTGPGGGIQTRSVWLRQNTADTTLTCGVTDTATAANDTADTINVVAGDLLAIRTNSSALAASPVTMQIGMVAYIASGPPPSRVSRLATLGAG